MQLNGTTEVFTFGPDLFLSEQREVALYSQVMLLASCRMLLHTSAQSGVGSMILPPLSQKHCHVYPSPVGMHHG